MTLQKLNAKKPVIRCRANEGVTMSFLTIGVAQGNSFNPLQRVLEVHV
ncbi:hypothetical protein MKX47_07125 [Solibacillus sp. FSL R7-0668]